MNIIRRILCKIGIHSMGQKLVLLPKIGKVQTECEYCPHIFYSITTPLLRDQR